MMENLVLRLGVHQSQWHTNFWVKLKSAAWSIPAINPLGNNAQNIFHYGDVGVFGKTGFKSLYSDQEVAFYLGMCSGAFYRQELVKVIQWPFVAQPPGHHYKWMAIGLGTIACWATGGGIGSSWTIDIGETVGGGQPFPPHKITEFTEGRGLDPDCFPGALKPLALDPVTLTNKPAQFKWVGAEGLFYPILQPPSDSGISP